MSNARNLARLLPNTSGQLPDANLAAIAAGKVSGQLADANMSSGSVLQVVTGRLGDLFTTSSTSFVDVPNLSATITPISTNSKILVVVSFGRATTTTNTLDIAAAIRVLCNGSDALNINGNTAGSRVKACMTIQGMSYNPDHSPGGFSVQAIETPNTTSSLTYKVQAAMQGSSWSLIVNGSPNNNDTGQMYNVRSQSSITLMEIAA